MLNVFHCEQDLLANLIVLTPKLARRKFKLYIFASWDWACAYCGKHLTQDTATIDHILSKHKGGHNIRSNMCCCCSSCNRSKGSMLLDEWYTENNIHFTEERSVKIKEWLEQKPNSIKLPSTDSLQTYIDNDFSISWISVWRTVSHRLSWAHEREAGSWPWRHRAEGRSAQRYYR